jgi:ribosomal protein S18 acetylase RimI-like enzyme
MVTLSRLGEEVVLWSTVEFGFLELPDAWSTGSSMMPQKKNPDVAELVRARTGRVIGRLAGLLATLKALPLAYDRDLQEDKEALFDALDTVASSARALAGVMGGARFAFERMASAAGGDALATELADALVREGVPFREAHHRVGQLLSGRSLAELSAKDLLDAGLPPEVPSADQVVATRSHHGGTAPLAVRDQMEELAHALARATARTEVAGLGASNVGSGTSFITDPSVQIRLFEEPDYLPLAEAVGEWYSQPMKAILLRRFVAHFSSTSFVAWRDGLRVGYVIGWLPPDCPLEVFVHSITLAPSERGRGTGRMLYARLAEVARRAGRRRMTATIRPHNDGSLAFHRALGFSFRVRDAVMDGRGIPVLVDWDGPGEDRVLAEADLEDLRL